MISSKNISEENGATSVLEKYFEPFRNNIVGINQDFDSPFGRKKLFILIGRQVGVCMLLLKRKYLRISDLLWQTPIRETSVTGTAMTKAYHEARKIIKKHVNAN